MFTSSIQMIHKLYQHSEYFVQSVGNHHQEKMSLSLLNLPQMWQSEFCFSIIIFYVNMMMKALYTSTDSEMDGSETHKVITTLEKMRYMECIL